MHAAQKLYYEMSIIACNKKAVAIYVYSTIWISLLDMCIARQIQHKPHGNITGQ